MAAKTFLWSSYFSKPKSPLSFSNHPSFHSRIYLTKQNQNQNQPAQRTASYGSSVNTPTKTTNTTNTLLVFHSNLSSNTKNNNINLLTLQKRDNRASASKRLLRKYIQHSPFKPRVHSAGQLLTAYIPPKPTPITTTLWWKQQWMQVRFKLFSLMNTLQIRREMTFSKKQMAETGWRLYTQVNKAFAQADLSTLRGLMSPDLFSVYKHKLQSRPSGVRFDWLVKGETKPKILLVAYTKVQEADVNLCFSQVTIEFDSFQKIVVVKGPGAEQKGDDGEGFIPVKETWVLELVGTNPEGWKVIKSFDDQTSSTTTSSPVGKQ
eukprot:TRINITY_DN1503_c0_g1_i1.p1 TRINITY_DN1503_c0_g1~~TRINITY_DN1503_c0_g1_i1.p1  ORF type:complete len:331 (-),score=91.46 TRINITY_DN1503_c0_g1_i1:13-972(-)